MFLAFVGLHTMMFFFHQHLILTAAWCLCILHAGCPTLRAEWGTGRKCVCPRHLGKLEMVWAKDHAWLVPLPLVPWSRPILLRWPAASQQWEGGGGGWSLPAKRAASWLREGRAQPTILWHQVPKGSSLGGESQMTAWSTKPTSVPALVWMQLTSSCISQWAAEQGQRDPQFPIQLQNVFLGTGRAIPKGTSAVAWWVWGLQSLFPTACHCFDRKTVSKWIFEVQSSCAAKLTCWEDP